jgi:tRNA pseudouridine38-40 synthase
MNSLLPLDIRVIHVEECTSHFHPIFNAKSKEYNYVFSHKTSLSPFAQELVTLVDFELNLSLMREGCKLLLGEHDFINYQCVGTEVDSTVRNIYECEILHLRSGGHWAELLDEYYVLRIAGDGFLKQMVRLIMGALWSLGREKITLEDLRESLTRPMESRLGATAPPQGLYLKVVHY